MGLGESIAGKGKGCREGLYAGAERTKDRGSREGPGASGWDKACGRYGKPCGRFSYKNDDL